MYAKSVIKVVKRVKDHKLMIAQVVFLINF